MSLRELKEKFLAFCDGGKVRMDESEMELLLCFVEKCQDEELIQKLLYELVRHRGIVNFCVLAQNLELLIHNLAQQRTRSVKIKNFKGSSYEEQCLLTNLFENKIKQTNALEWV